MSTTTIAWLLLLLAGLLEIVWAVGLKYSQGFTKLWPSVITIIAMIASMILLARAVKVLPVGTAYAVWVGIGALGAAVLGIVLFNEARNPARLMFVAMLLVSIIGVKLTSSS